MISSEPLVSIVIVNWNVREFLRDCLVSIREEMRLEPHDYEVIVVDNASADDSVSMIESEFDWVRLIRSDENLGFGRGCNLGYTHAAGTYVMLLNPDTVVTNHAVDTLLEKMLGDESVGIVGGRMQDEHGNFRHDSGGALPTLGNVAWNFLFLRKLLPERLAPDPYFMEHDLPGDRDIQWLSGADMLLRRSALGDRIFDESFFMYGEDLELCHRVASAGWRIRYTSDATFIHHSGKSYARQTSEEVQEMIHKGPRRFFARTHGPVALALYDAIYFFGYFARWFGFTLAAVLSPARFRDRAAFSRRYLAVMFRLMLKGSNA